ncbi:MAG: hypothetical protein IPP79_13420 [Chitinophagaceae bacterium]|nr:hypothetical protein [Chitinophagaceae bacterium]
MVGIIKKYIPSKKEAGLAEALLIAYKDDLDKTLVQSYANTGVVHICYFRVTSWFGILVISNTTESDSQLY